MLLWHTLAAYFRRKYGYRVQKIPLDANASCPNRDGTLNTHGCVFCNTKGAGSGLAEKGISLESQWKYWQHKYLTTDANRAFMAYLQSFSNTYCTAEHLAQLLQRISALPNCMGISIGTRPDCLDSRKLELIASLPLPEVWLELGLQSCHETTLTRINRHHSAACAEQTIHSAASYGIKICGHLMAGLPDEDEQMFQESVLWAVSLPIAGIKLHNVYVPEGSTLGKQYLQKKYLPLSSDEYVNMLCNALPHIPSSIVMHRLTGDPSPQELLAPAWAANKRALITEIHRAMSARKLWQGCKADVPEKRPLWYGG